jgi:predicted nucleic acid-binding protein
VIILDTNVIAELMRPAPERAVVAWVGSRAPSSLFTTTINEAELRYGLAILPLGRRRRALASAVDELFAVDFAQRVLPFDSAAAQAYASLAAKRRKAGRPMAQLDAQIAAIAVTRQATLATRNESDFRGCGIKLANPWPPG